MTLRVWDVTAGTVVHELGLNPPFSATGWSGVTCLTARSY
jgi:hypothetical protein